MNKNVHKKIALCVMTLLCAHTHTLWAGDMVICSSIEQAEERLACYDREAGREVATPTGAAEQADVLAPGPFGMITTTISPLDDRWELIPGADRPVFTFRSYKSVYFMPVYHTDNINQKPCSVGGKPENCSPQDLALDDTEAKFQISFKTKVAADLFGGKGDVWVAYTQSSRWQIYSESAPFRETNYEPEIMMAFPSHHSLLGWKVSVWGLGFNHQSNGRTDPYSRSWNRIVAFAALQKESWILEVKPWYRIPELDEIDDNPDIEEYIGRAEFGINKRAGQNNLALTLRHSMEFEDSRGSAQLEWTFPISDYLKGYVQVFSGYGESLIDYNHNQTTLGIGITLVDWR